MKTHALNQEQFIARPREEVFAFFADAANLGRITPPWLHFRILSPTPIAMRRGARIDYRIRLRGIPIVWKTEIVEWHPPDHFVDVQLQGPYRLWEHRHEFIDVAGGTLARDEVRYALPGGWVTEPLRRWIVARDIAAIFGYRREAMTNLFPSSAAGEGGTG